MAYTALYRKYRPTVFSDVYGQEHITETLKSELQNGKTVHAYLFTGTRGTGKTTCAKILAKAVNCLNPKDGNPCGECEICKAIAEDKLTDICEIDAASNNGVDDIRTLREQVNFSPSVAKYRVYIIDEVHMLSQSAFNALLKTLEEPPAHVVFILATTEVHKLPSTILSRCQRFDFRRIDPERITDRIKYIAEKEGFTVTDDAAKLIAATADGGMRDALSVLDLCASVSKDVTEETVVSVCAMAGNEYLLKLAGCIKDKNTDEALILLNELHNSSVDMQRLLSELTEHFRDLMIAKAIKEENLPIVCSKKKLQDIKNQASRYDIREIISILEVMQNTAEKMQSGNRRTEMEMMIIRLCNPALGNDLSSLESRISALEINGVAFAGTVKSEPQKAKSSETPDFISVTDNTADITDEDLPLPEIPSEEPEFPQKNASVSDGALKNWEDILKILKTSCPIIAGVLHGSNAYIEGDRLLIETDNTQFRSLINGSNTIYRESIRKAAETVLGKSYGLGPYKPKNNTSREDDPLPLFAEKLKNLEK